MRDLDAALAENAKQVEHFIAALPDVRDSWNVPVRPGKWSPARVAEHIALSYRETTALAQGDASGFPRVPALLRPLIRSLGFKRVLKTGRFMKSRTFKSLTPLQGPPTPEDAATKIRAVQAEFEASFKALRAQLQHPAFGTVEPADYVRFLGFHTVHHERQLTP
jgi:hypothetical protein